MATMSSVRVDWTDDAPPLVLTGGWRIDNLEHVGFIRLRGPRDARMFVQKCMIRGISESPAGDTWDSEIPQEG